MEYIIDFQAFKKPVDDFVLKELIILNCETQLLQSFTFKPPFEWCILPIKYKVENKWLENHYIHKSWTSGDVEYSELENILLTLSQAKKVYIFGEEKAEWLQQRLNNVCNLQDQSAIIEEIKKIKHFRCKIHLYNKNYVNCVLCNVNVLYYTCMFF